MTLPPLQVLRRWRSIIVAGVLIGVVVGWLSAPGRVVGSTTYEATHQLILDPPTRGGSEVNRAAVLATLGAVPDRVADRLGIDRRLIRSMVSAGTHDDVGVVLITGRSTDPAQAEALADVTAEEVLAELGGPRAPLRSLERATASPVASTTFEGPRSRTSRALLLGAFGLLLGVGGAFGIERLDPRIRSKQAAEGALGAPVLAEVPVIPPREEGPHRLVGSGSPLLVEPYRRLGLFVDGMAVRTEFGAGTRVVAVTSADIAEGKTTTVAHLAAALGELGRSVLAVSADLRRPHLHCYFDRPGEPGLADVLRGRATLDGLDLATPMRGVLFLASGAAVENPAPLLDRAGDVLRAARSLADVVLVDTPPLLTVSDTAELARHADGVLLVVRAGHTTTRAATRSAELLERLSIPLLGAVLVGAGGPPPSRIRFGGTEA